MLPASSDLKVLRPSLASAPLAGALFFGDAPRWRVVPGKVASRCAEEEARPPAFGRLCVFPGRPLLGYRPTRQRIGGLPTGSAATGKARSAHSCPPLGRPRVFGAGGGPPSRRGQNAPAGSLAAMSHDCVVRFFEKQFFKYVHSGLAARRPVVGSKQFRPSPPAPVLGALTAARCGPR
jgi:hypothetical protein